jgi:hypothetical protein
VSRPGEQPTTEGWYRSCTSYSSGYGSYSHDNTWNGNAYHGGSAGYNSYTGRYGASKSYYNPDMGRYGSAQAVYNPYTNRDATHDSYGDHL